MFACGNTYLDVPKVHSVGHSAVFLLSRYSSVRDVMMDKTLVEFKFHWMRQSVSKYGIVSSVSKCYGEKENREQVLTVSGWDCSFRQGDQEMPLWRQLLS